MRIHQFLEHHQITRNPFAEEDAQTDPVFKDHCISNTYHPTWDKVYGDPGEPSTSIVFGEKGSGKTALRLQIAKHLAEHNKSHPNRRSFVVAYDDFNPFLDRFCDRLVGRRRRADRVLLRFQLWDHMDAILSLAVTDLVDQILVAGTQSSNRDAANSVSEEQYSQLDRHQRRDLLLLAACYDQSTAETFSGRWRRLRRTLQFSSVRTWWRLALGTSTTLLVALCVIYLLSWEGIARFWWVFPAAIVMGWMAWLWHAGRCFQLAWGIVRHVRVGIRQTRLLGRILRNFTPSEFRQRAAMEHKARPKSSSKTNACWYKSRA